MRLFTALWPDEPTRDAIAQWQAAWSWPPKAAPVKPERLHLTLHFLGDVQPDLVAPLRDSLRVRFEPFTLEMGRGDVWGNGVAVLLPHNTPAALRDLHLRTAEAIRGVGLPTETRPYKPHVTLARRAWHAQPPDQAFAGRWQAGSGFVLVQTMPGGGGYRIVDRFG